MFFSDLKVMLARIHRDTLGGALMLVFGAAAIYAGIGYRIGQLKQIGSGFFPTMLGVILVLVGALIMLGARKKETASTPVDAEPRPAFDARGWIFIILGLLAFVVVGKYGGLLPATFLIVFVSALGDRSNTFKSALILALAMCVVSAVVFWWALKMQFPLLTWG